MKNRKKVISILFLIFLSDSSLLANNARELALKLNLQPGTKATVQWERVFSSKRHLQRYKLVNISPMQREELKNYLIRHSADSEQPILPGL